MASPDQNAAKKFSETASSEPGETPSKENVETPSREGVETLSKEKIETPSKEGVETPSKEQIEIPAKKRRERLSVMDIMQAPIKLTVSSGSKEKVSSKEKVETPSKESAETSRADTSRAVTPEAVTPGAVTPATERTKKEQEQSKVEKISGKTITQRLTEGDEQAAEDARKEQQKWPSWNLSKMAFFVSVGGGFNFGYQLLITNPAQMAFLSFLDDSYAATHGVRLKRDALEYTWGAIVSSIFWGATISAVMIKATANYFGRRNGIILTFIIQDIALALEVVSYFANSYVIYAVARIVLGSAISVSIGIAPLYIIECSPVGCRGTTSMATGVFLRIGLVTGSIIAMPELLGTESLWWVIYGVEFLLTVFVTIGLFLVPESPTWLLTKNLELAAEKSIVFYHGVSPVKTAQLISDLKKGIAGEKPLGLFAIFKDTKWLCGFLLGLAIMAGTILCGVPALNAFAFEILLNVGLDEIRAALGNLAISAMTLVGVLISGQLVEYMGRRPLLLITFGGLSVVNILIPGFMALFYYNHEEWVGWCVVACICSFNLMFAGGPGALCFFVPGEIVSHRSRSAMYTWLNIVLNALRSISLVIYLPVQHQLGLVLSYFLMFFPPTAAITLICYLYLPETTGLSPEQARKAMHKLPGFCGKEVLETAIEAKDEEDNPYRLPSGCSLWI